MRKTIHLTDEQIVRLREEAKRRADVKAAELQEQLGVECTVRVPFANIVNELYREVAAKGVTAVCDPSINAAMLRGI
jgi:hypothetical protein